MSGVLPFLLNKGTNNDLSAYRTGAAQDSVTESRALLGTLARAVRDSLFFDAVTSGSRALWNLGTAGAVKTSQLTIPWLVFVDGVNRAGQNPRGIWTLSNTTTDYDAGSLSLYRTENDLVLNLRKTGGGATDRRLLTVANFFLGRSAGWVPIHVTWSRASAPTIYADGAALTAVVETTTGSPPDWTQACSDAYLVAGIRNGTEMWGGGMIPGSIINGVLTPAEVLRHAQTGELPDWCKIATGSAAPVYSSNFSAGTDSWSFTHPGNVLTGNVDAIGGLDDNLRLVTGAANPAGGASRSSTFSSVGKKYRITMSVYAPAANTSKTVRITDGSASSAFAGVADTVLAPDTWTSITVEAIVANTALVFRAINAVATDTFYVRGVSVVELGPIFRPIIQPIPVVGDAGANGICGVLTSGVTPITDRRDWFIRTVTNTLGNQQLLGANVFTDYTRQVIDSWSWKTAGTPTVYGGSASGDNGYVASVALAARVNPATLVKRYASSNALWANSTTTDPIVHTIRGHLAD